MDDGSKAWEESSQPGLAEDGWTVVGDRTKTATVDMEREVTVEAEAEVAAAEAETAELDIETEIEMEFETEVEMAADTAVETGIETEAETAIEPETETGPQPAREVSPTTGVAETSTDAITAAVALASVAYDDAREEEILSMMLLVQEGRDTVKTLAEAMRATSDQRDQLVDEIECLREQVGVADSGRARAEEQLGESRAMMTEEIDTLRESLLAAETAADTAAAKQCTEVESLTAQLDGQSAVVTALERTVSDLRDAAAKTTAHLEESVHRAQALEKQRDLLADRLSLADVEMGQRRKRELEGEQRLSAAEAAATELRATAKAETAALITELAKLRSQLEESQEEVLKRNQSPWARVVVLCVDISGSLGLVLDQVYSIYLSILAVFRARCPTGLVGVVSHGCDGDLVQVSAPLMRVDDQIKALEQALEVGRGGGGECYSEALAKAMELLAPVRKLVDDWRVITIGDGEGAADEYEAPCWGTVVHSIIVPNGQYGRHLVDLGAQESLSNATGGRCVTVQEGDDKEKMIEYLLFE